MRSSTHWCYDYTPRPPADAAAHSRYAAWTSTRSKDWYGYGRKGETLPISLDLAVHLVDHADNRGAVTPADRLLRYRDGRPLTARRYDHLWKRRTH